VGGGGGGEGGGGERGVREGGGCAGVAGWPEWGEGVLSWGAARRKQRAGERRGGGGEADRGAGDQLGGLFGQSMEAPVTPDQSAARHRTAERNVAPKAEIIDQAAEGRRG